MIVLFISGTILVGALLIYHKSPHVAVLRGIAIILLYLIITGFSFPIRKKSSRTAPLVLIDASQSMAGYHKNIKSACADIGFEHKILYFSEKLVTPSIDSISNYGKYTDIIGALHAVKDDHPAAVILISDGNHNYQGTTQSDLRNYDTPVYAFGVGSEESRDVELLQVSYPDYVYLGDSVDIDVIVQSYGYEKGSAAVELRFDHSQKTQRRTFQLSNTKAKSTISFHINYSHPADTSMTATILPSSDEAYTDNNARQFSLMPIEYRIRVIYYTDHVSFNTKFIMQALNENPRIEVTYIARLPSGRYIDPRTSTKCTVPLLDTIDAVILDNISCTTLPWPHLTGAVEKGLGLLCLGTIQQITPEWQTILPITIADVTIQGNSPITITEGFSCLVLNRTYPPFSQMQRVLGTQEHGVTIATTNNIPVIAYRRSGKGTVFQINCIQIGTWYFMQKGMYQTDILSCLLADIIRFVAPEGRNKRLVLSIPQSTAAVGERVELLLKSYDLDFRKTGEGDFSIEVNSQKIPFFETEKGVYHTSFIAEKEGKMTLTASGVLNSEPLTSNTVTLQVSKSTMEQVQTLNRSFLNKIAQYTGGTYHPIDSLPDFAIPESPPSYHVRHINLNNPITFLLVIAFLVTDWIVRRRRGAV